MKYIFIFILLLCSFNIFAQKEQQQEIYYQYEQKSVQEEIKFHTQKDWTIENLDHWGSFMWIVIRTEKPDVNGDYWYYVYLYSNSYFNKKVGDSFQKAITYISELHIYMMECTVDGKLTNAYDDYIAYTTCDHYPELDPKSYITVFSSKSKYNKFRVKFAECSAYLNSKYN